MKREKGFTIVELLTSVAIIALLLGILVPSLNTVKKIAKQASQKAQFMAIETGLLGFKNDFGDYPDSFASAAGSGTIQYNRYGDYSGAQKLAEAMVGWDLMGFHPNTAWRADGLDINGNDTSYDPAHNRINARNEFTTLTERKGVYVEPEKVHVFRLGNSTTYGDVGLFNFAPNPLEGMAYVMCDVYGIRNMQVGNKIVKAGTPILYFKANTTSKLFRDSPSRPPTTPSNSIYDIWDNIELMTLGVLTSNGGVDSTRMHPFIDPTYNPAEEDLFYGFETKYGIRDSKTSVAWPHNPETYILISAGPDGLYGTADDIRNFGN